MGGRHLFPAKTLRARSDAIWGGHQVCARGGDFGERLQGGSVTMASKRPPRRQGCRVMSNVHKSKMRCRTPYWAAARRMPGWASGHAGRVSMIGSRFPRICRPSMSEPNSSAPK